MFSEKENPSLCPEKSKKIATCSAITIIWMKKLGFYESINNFQKEPISGCLKILIPHSQPIKPFMLLFSFYIPWKY